MNILKNIFARVWALWGIVSFIATFLLVLIPSFFTTFIKDETRSQDVFISMSRVWMNIWLRLIGCSIKIKGLENFSKKKACIITLNHNTFLDVPISCPFVPFANKTIAKDSFAKIPLFGWYYRKGGVLVNRKSEASRRDSFYKMKDVLAKGMHMCIYPEGTRNRTSQPLKSFYDGAFKLAVETKHEIIPTLIFNTNKALPNNRFFYLIPQKLEMHFLEPVSPNHLSVVELKQKVFDIMHDYYVKNS